MGGALVGLGGQVREAGEEGSIGRMLRSLRKAINSAFLNRE